MNRLDTEIINQKAKYAVKLVRDDLYEFCTDNGMVYEIGFPLDNPIGDCETYQFFLNCTTTPRPPRDFKVKSAVLAILEEFFAKNDSVILYVCDTSDRRQNIRRYLFERWFNYSPSRSQFLVMSGCLVDEGVENYTSIIVKNTNPKLSDIVTDFTDTIRLLNQDKPCETARENA